MPGTVSISRADIKSREKEWFGGSRDQFSASLQQSRRRSSLERGTLANPTGFGNPRQSTYDEPIYRSDEPGVSLHEEHRRTFGRGGMGREDGYFSSRPGVTGGADDPLQYNQDDADWTGSKYQRGFHSEGFPPISGTAEPPARSLFADSGNAYSGEGGDRFAPSSYGAGGAPSTSYDYGSSSNYEAPKSSYGDYGASSKPTDYGTSNYGNYGTDYGTTTPAAEEKKSTHLYDHAHVETRPTSRNRKTVIIAGSSPLDAPGDEKRLTIHASDLKSHGNVVKVDEDDLEHMKSKGDIDFVESSIENARAQVTNVEKVTRTLESLHNEMHDFEVRESASKLTLNLTWY